jgi:multidrug efflux pump
VIAWLVNHRTTVLLAVLAVFLFGMVSYRALPREAAPEVTIPVVLVVTPFPGTSPGDVESLVTIPLENELAGIKDVESISSTSAEGASMITVEFEPEMDIAEAVQRVREQVDRARPQLPEDAEVSDVREVNFEDFPFLIVALGGELGEVGLKDLAEDLSERVLRISGVLEARVNGGLERQVSVEVDPVRLQHYGLSLDDVINGVRAENVDVPGGTVSSGDASWLLRVPGSFERPADLGEVALKRVGDRPVFLRDVATVVDGFEDRGSYARLNGQPAVSLAVTKRAGTNLLEISEQVKALVGEQAELWPAGVEVRFTADQSRMIRDRVAELEDSILTALVLVVGVIFFFMGARSSFFVALAIPLSMLASFIVLEALGITLNFVVLFSLILALGMLVDNAIVVVENVYRHLEQGKGPMQASIDGAREVAKAVIASTLTTVAAFLPLVFWGGIMGQFMGYLPKTVIIVLVASLVVGLGVLPVATAAFLKRKGGGSLAILREDAEPTGPGLRARVMRGYRAALRWTVRHPYISVSAGFAALLATFVSFGFLNHGTEFFPDAEPDSATITIRAPDGTDLEATDRIVRQVEAVLAAEADIDLFVAETGVGGGGGFMGPQAVGNQARITIELRPTPQRAQPGETPRSRDARALVEDLRQQLALIPGAEIDVDRDTMGPPVGKDIAVQVKGEDFHELGALAAQVQRELLELEGVADLGSDYRVGRPELALRIDRGAAKRVGASTIAVANTLRTAVAGAVASTLRDGDEELDIVVRLEPEARADLQQVLSLRIPGREDRAPETFAVPLSAVADFELAGGAGSIRRLDQDRVVTLEGDVVEGANANAVRAEVATLLAGLDLPDGYVASMGGADDNQKEAMAFLLRAFAIAVALILLVLVTQFDSLTMPAIILTTVLLSLIGVLWGLVITGTPFGIVMTGIGVISLAGVVVNNAIVLLDYAEQLRERGVPFQEAVIRAGMARFRPVMLTAVTTVLGLVPLAVGLSVDLRNLRVVWGGQSAEWWQSMAMAVIFGLIFATALTLLMVPTLYSLREDLARRASALKDRFGRGFRQRRLAVAAKLALVGFLGGGLALASAWTPEARAVSLEEALRAAERHSPDLRLLEEQVEQARAQRARAWATVGPRLSASGAYSVNDKEIAFDPTAMSEGFTEPLLDAFEDMGIPVDASAFEADGEPVVIQEKTAWSASVTLSQPLFDAQALPAVRGATALVEAAEADTRQRRQALHALVARSVYLVHAARESVTLAQEALETARHQQELASRQVASGAQPPRVQLQADIAVAAAERDLEQARELRVSAEGAFRTATGLERDAVVEIPPAPALPSGLEQALSEALNGRGDLEAASRRGDAARLQLTADRLDWLPTLSADFTWRYSDNTGFSDDPTAWMLSLGAHWTLWDGGFRLAQARSDASALRQAELQRERLLLALEEQLGNAWASLERAERSLALVERQVALADENLRQVEAGFEAGSASWIEVDAARLEQRRAQLGLVQERAARDLAAVDLLVATGRYDPLG